MLISMSLCRNNDWRPTSDISVVLLTPVTDCDCDWKVSYVLSTTTALEKGSEILNRALHSGWPWMCICLMKYIFISMNNLGKLCKEVELYHRQIWWIHCYMKSLCTLWSHSLPANAVLCSALINDPLLEYCNIALLEPPSSTIAFYMLRPLCR